MKKASSEIEDTEQQHHDELPHQQAKPISLSGAANDSEASYFSLLRNNRPFRLYLTSYLITHAGEWFTYVASISMIERFLDIGGESLSSTKISILVVVRLFPNVLLSAVGGTLSDSRDRRISMIFLDVMGAVVALLYLAAYHLRSIVLVYVVAFLQQCVAALYEPCRSAIVPLMVSTEGDLKKATTLSVLAWSLMAAIGAALGGLFVAIMGIQLCFVVDSMSYLVSALLIQWIGGEYNAAEGHERKYESVWEQIKGMTVDGARYLCSSFFGGIVFVKASGAILFGASDVLNVSFAERDVEAEGNASLRMGAIFAASGIGCLLGPLGADYAKGETPPASYLQLGFIGGLSFLTAGYFALGLTQNFLLICLISVFRAAGSSLLWIDSSVILQMFSAPHVLGRVMAVEYAIATLMEALSAVFAGYSQDHFDMTPQGVSLVLSAMGTVIALMWSIYHWSGRGVAGYTTHVQLPTQEADGNSGIEISLLAFAEDSEEGVHHRDTVNVITP